MADQEDFVVRREYPDRPCPRCGKGHLQEAVSKSEPPLRWDALKSWFRCSAAPGCDYTQGISGGGEVH
jgi:hypothetical protein